MSEGYAPGVRTRIAALKAAARIALTRQPRAVTFDSVCTSAKMSRGRLTAQYASQHQLLSETVAQILDHLRKRLVQPLYASDVSVRDRIVACADALREEYGAFEKPGCLMLFVAADPSLPQDLHASVNAFLREWLEALSLLVHPTVAIEAVAAVQGSITLTRILNDRSILDDAIARFASTIINNLNT